MTAFLLYFGLLVFLFLAKEVSSLFFTIVFIICISPVLFYDLDKFGFGNIRSAVLGLLLSAVYLPFINLSYLFNISIFSQALCEEIFFRGYLQNEIGKKVNPYMAIVVTSFLFTIPHLVLSFSLQALLTFFPSLVFGYLYYKTNSIWASTIFHFMSNVFFLSQLKEFF